LSLVHHKSYLAWPGIEAGPPCGEDDMQTPETRYDSLCHLPRYIKRTLLLNWHIQKLGFEMNLKTSVYQQNRLMLVYVCNGGLLGKKESSHDRWSVIISKGTGD